MLSHGAGHSQIRLSCFAAEGQILMTGSTIRQDNEQDTGLKVVYA